MSLKELRKKLHGKTKGQLIRIILIIFHRSPKNIKHMILTMVKISHTRSKTRKSKRKSRHRKSKTRKGKGKSKRSKLSIKRERIRNLNKGRKKAGLKAIPIPRR